MQNRLTIFDLVSGQVKNYDLHEGCDSIDAKIRCALYDDSVYLSLYNFELWGTKAYECTLEINRETDQIDIIDDQFYENLLCTDTALYGGKIHEMTKVCEFGKTD